MILTFGPRIAGGFGRRERLTGAFEIIFEKNDINKWSIQARWYGKIENWSENLWTRANNLYIVEERYKMVA